MVKVVGQIQLFAFGSAPDNWLLCDGNTYQTSAYPTLYSCIGKTFGGDEDTFAVPDLSTARPLNIASSSYLRYYIATEGANSDEDRLIGTIRLFPCGKVPLGWSLCDGARIEIRYNTWLYSLIGNRFGGDGKTYYLLPNLQGAEPAANLAYYIACEGLYPTWSQH